MKESDKQKEFIRKYKRNKIKVVFIQVFILIGILLLWEVLAYKEVINSFITSCPILLVCLLMIICYIIFGLLLVRL